MTHEQQDAANEPVSRESLAARARRITLTVGAVLALVGAVMGFVADALGLFEFGQGMLGREKEPVAHVTPAATPAPSPSPTVTPTPEPTSTPTATPLPVIAADGERLLLVTQFANYAQSANFNVAGRIVEALSSQVRAAELADTRVAVWPDAVGDENKAVGVLDATRAAMVIWGEYDSGRVRVNFALPGRGKAMDWQRLLGGPDELSTTINLDVPREAQALALMALGRLYRDAGEYARARAAFQRALALGPIEPDTVATLNFYLAYLYANTQPIDLDAAIAGYGRVMELRPDWINAVYNRGVAYLDRYFGNPIRDNLDLALADFTAALAAHPTHVDALINRGIAYYARNDDGDLVSALRDLDAAAQLAPGDYRPFFNRGLARIRAADGSDWAADLQTSLALAPIYWQAHYALCWGYALANQPEEGKGHCDHAAEHDTSGAISDARALILAELGLLEEAAAEAQVYLTWLETLPPAWYPISNGPVFEEVLVALSAGQNPVTPDLLARLR
jgi:tetratricopeptide (TPR) repeat protein